MARQQRQIECRPKTFAGYASIIEQRIKPRIGHFRLKQITPDVVQAFYVDLADTGLSPRSVVAAHRVRRKALAQAVMFGRILRNPCDVVEAPRVGREEKKTLMASQVTHLLDVTRDERFGPMYTVAVSTGLRLGKLLGLKWSGVNLDGRRLVVKRSLQ